MALRNLEQSRGVGKRGAETVRMLHFYIFQFHVLCAVQCMLAVIFFRSVEFRKVWRSENGNGFGEIYAVEMGQSHSFSSSLCHIGGTVFGVSQHLPRTIRGCASRQLLWHSGFPVNYNRGGYEIDGIQAWSQKASLWACLFPPFLQVMPFPW